MHWGLPREDTLGLRLWHHVADHSVFCTEFSAAKFARDAHAFGDRINVVDSRKLDHLFPAGGPVDLEAAWIARVS